jgi:hypothetical protein
MAQTAGVVLEPKSMYEEREQSMRLYELREVMQHLLVFLGLLPYVVKRITADTPYEWADAVWNAIPNKRSGRRTIPVSVPLNEVSEWLLHPHEEYQLCTNIFTHFSTMYQIGNTDWCHIHDIMVSASLLFSPITYIVQHPIITI